MPGTLSVVATPIGNLEDITLRGLRVLGEADLIAAEDTRRTASLLARYSIKTPMVSFHEHNAARRLPQLLARLTAGAHIAMVSDAGTPGLSDPGVELVRACISQGIPVDPIPGACAPLTAAMASGFALTPLTVLGFPPHRSKDRTAWIKSIYGVSHTVIFFEAPHRIVGTIREMAHVMGNRQIVVARELTKKYQTWLRGTLSSVEATIGVPKGEYTIVLGPTQQGPGHGERPCGPETAEAVVGRMTDFCRPLSRRSVRELAVNSGVRPNVLYKALQKARRRD
jgi:16S rRNA (cytidine1402-2'-O)-methyltransferase